MAKSPGPRTRRGRARSSQNAAKHWIESGRILPDEQKEAAILRAGLTEDFKPQGAIENEVVDDLTFNRLIKRRVDVAFTREFSKATTEKAIELWENRNRSVARYWLQISDNWRRVSPRPEQAERLRPDSCLAFLEGLKLRIGERGPQPLDLEMLHAAYGDQPTEHAARAMYLLVQFAEQQKVQDEKERTTGAAGIQKEILDALQDETEFQKEREELREDITDIECFSDLQEPAGPALETLLRYRAANVREFKDLLDSLGRIRRLRGSSS